MSKKFNEKSISETVAAIKNCATESKCITIFEELLSEVLLDDEVTVKTVIADTNRFIEDTKLIFSEVRKINLPKMKSRIVSSEFIRPENYFIRTKSCIQKFHKLNKFSEHTTYLPDEISGGKDKEITRKLVLIWNYIPAICKAIIQTERRKLGFDNNSSKY